MYLHLWLKFKIFFTRQSPAVRWTTVALIVLVISIGLFGIARPAHADVFSWAWDNFIQTIADLLLNIAAIIGKIVIVLIDILIGIVQYNDFIRSNAVSTGWVVVRDLCNMFFVAVLLIIAFGTILRIESYKYQSLLPKLILMAVLINFSKVISGFLIDVSQVVLLTFVNAFKDSAAGNFVSVFQLKSMLGFIDPNAPDQATTLSDWQKIGLPLFAIMLMTVTFFVMLAMIIVFIARIVYLWVLVVLSPLAYLLAVVPSGKQYASRWWSTFGKWLTTGPVLAFFIWLALSILTTSSGDPSKVVNLSGDQGNLVNSGMANAGMNPGLGTVSSSDNLLGFIIAVALLVMAMGFAQALGGFAGKWAGNMMGKVQAMGSGVLKAGGGILKLPAKGAGYAAKKIYAKTGIELRPTKIRDNIREGMKQKREKDELSGRQAAGAKMREKGGLRAAIYGLGTPDFAEQYMRGFLATKGIKRLFKYRPERMKELQGKQDKTNEEIAELKKLEALENPVSAYETYHKGEMVSAQENKQHHQDEINRIEAELARPTDINDRKTRLEQNIAQEMAKTQVDQDKVDKWNEQIRGLDEELAKINADPERTTRLNRQKAEEQVNLDNERNRYDAAQRAYTNFTAPGRSDAEKTREAKTWINDKYNREIREIDSELANIQSGKMSTPQQRKMQKTLEQIEKDIAKLDEEKRIKLALDPNANTDREDALRQALLNKRQPLIDPTTNTLRTDRTEEQDKELAESNYLTDLQKKRESLEKERDYGRDVTSRAETRKTLEELEAVKKKQGEQLVEMASYAPQDYYSRAAGREAINKEARKIDTENEDELIALFNNAMRNKDRFLAGAVAKRSAEVGHLNELLNAQGLTANQDGMNTFINERFIKDLGMAQQAAYNLQNDLSETAQKINHWTFAQSVGVENGLYHQRTADTQGYRSFIEMSKRDLEGLMRQGNRLMYGGEDKDGNFVMGRQGLLLIRKNYDQMMKSMGKERFNKNAAMKLITDDSLAKLEDLLEKDQSIDRRIFNGFRKSLKDFAAGSINELKGEAEIVNRVING